MLDLFQYDFMIRAVLSGLVIGLIAPMIGMFLVVRRYALMADTLAHVSLAGVAIGLLAGWNPVLTAVVTSVAGALGIEKLRTERNIGGESVLALFLSGSLALAVVLISLAQGFNSSLFSVLFGSISTVSQADLFWVIGLGLAVIIALILLYKELFLISFSQELAQSQGLNVKLINSVFIVLAAVTVSVSMQIIGVLLIGALMVIPVITAMRYGYGFRATMLIAVIFSLFSVIAGLVVSYYFDVASGGTIVLITLVLFAVSLLVNRKKS